jgi:hypothetical protein
MILVMPHAFGTVAGPVDIDRADMLSAQLPWPTKNLPEDIGTKEPTLKALIGEYLFVPASLLRVTLRDPD